MNEVLYVATCINVGTVFDPAKNKVTTAGKEVMSLYLKWQMGYLLRFTHSSCIFVGVVNFGMKYRWDEAYYNVIFLFFSGRRSCDIVPSNIFRFPSFYADGL